MQEPPITSVILQCSISSIFYRFNVFNQDLGYSTILLNPLQLSDSMILDFILPFIMRTYYSRKRELLKMEGTETGKNAMFMK